MKTVTLTIDGHEIVAEKDLTILEVAKRSDITIPTLCYVKGKSSDNPCEICVVEVAGNDELCVFKFQNSGIVCLDNNQENGWYIKWALMPNIP